MAQTFVRPAVGARAMTLAGKCYSSPDVFQRERERIFSREWICVGHKSAIDQPGSYLVADVCGESIVVVRDGSDAIRAFYNVCRHRGTQICTERAGYVAGAFQCPYHAWTYALDGALLAARNMQGVPGFDRANYALHRVAVAEAGGFVFVSLSRDPSASAPLAPLAQRLERWNTAGLQEARRLEYEVACNWKLVFQNYSECYHCPVIHPQLEKLSPSDSGRNDFVSGPILGGYSDLRPSASALSTSGARAFPPIGGVNGPDLTRVYYYTIFPSLLLSLHPDFVMAHTLRPRAADRTEITCSFLFDAQTADDPAFDPSGIVEFWDTTNRQDWRVNELTQRGAMSRAYEPGPYANAEGLLHAFDRYYLSVMDAKPDGDEMVQ